MSTKRITAKELISNLKMLDWEMVDYSSTESKQEPIAFEMGEDMTDAMPLQQSPFSHCKITQCSDDELVEILQLMKEKNVSEDVKLLDLSYNQLTSIPQEISNLKQLKWLYLNCNQLESLPNTLTELKKLQELSVAYNQLSKLPNMKQYPQLRFVDFSHNQLKKRPKGLGSTIKVFANDNLFKANDLTFAYQRQRKTSGELKSLANYEIDTSSITQSLRRNRAN